MAELGAFRVILSLLLGGAIGFFIGLTGIGGGVLVWPALVFLLGVEPVAAVGTALFFALVARIAAAPAHWKHGNISPGTAGWFILGTIPTMVATAWGISELKRLYPTPTDAAVKIAVGVVILGSMALMAWNIAHATRPTSADNKSKKTSYRRKAIAFGLLIGLVMGGTSIGGGVFILPVLLTWFHLTPRQAAGTSLSISTVPAVLGTLVYMRYGQVDWPVALLMFLGSLPAAWMGSRLAARIPARALRVVMLMLMLIAAIISLAVPRPTEKAQPRAVLPHVREMP